MKTQVRFIFKPHNKEYTMRYKEQLSLEQLLNLIEVQKSKLESELQISNLKAYIRKQQQNQHYPQYLKLSNLSLPYNLFRDKKEQQITVQFFFKNRKQSITASLNIVGSNLQEMKSDLKKMVNELKDEGSQYYAMGIISKTSRSYSIAAEIEHSIDIFLVVSDPIASFQNGQAFPIYDDEVNIPSHIERLKRASMSDSNLTIKVKRQWGTKQKLISILKQEEGNKKKISIVQLFTQVRRINGKLMLSLEGPLGERAWQTAEEILAHHQVDLLIIIGVGANLLQEINYPKPQILITSISVEEKRIITQYRSALNSQNIYNDTIPQVFLESFYQNLFKRTEIGVSVQLAKKEAGKLASNSVWCCCLHEHAPNCGWQEIIAKIGYMEAHRLFKHSDYRKMDFYEVTFNIQQILLDKDENCSSGNICCYQKLGESKTSFHSQVSKILLWNQKCSQVLYSSIEDNQKRLNKFEAEDYDKPSGRRRPLTVYKLLQAIIKKGEQILIIRSPSMLSLAKRYFSFAKEYLQARDKDAYFCEYAINKEFVINKSLNSVVEAVKSKAKLGTINVQKISLYVQTLFDSSKPDKYYSKIFDEEPAKLISKAKALGLQVQRIKIILLMCQPNLGGKYPEFKIDDPYQCQLYHYHFSKYSYDDLKQKLSEIKSLIKKQQMEKDMQVAKICDDMIVEDLNQFLFLGFISLFSQDGFYLTNYGRIVLENIFGQEVIEKAANHALPIQVIHLSDCMYIQLQKSYQYYFINNSGNFPKQFQQKRLRYYYILFRTYCELYITTNFENYEGTLRRMANKQGLFSINILEQRSNFDDIVQNCKQALQKVPDISSLIEFNSFRHYYHLNQIEKIIKFFMIRKKNQYVATSTSIIRQEVPIIVTYLLWNITHFSWKIILATFPNIEKVKAFQEILQNFLKNVEITTPIAEVARLQLYMMIGRIPPKSQEIFKYSRQANTSNYPNSYNQAQRSNIRSNVESSYNRQINQSSFRMYSSFRCSKQMSKLLNFLRIYSIQQYNLSLMEIDWGHLLKFQEEISVCIKIAQKIIDLLQTQNEQFKEELETHRMFDNCTTVEWNREILKFTQRKILYYFQLTKMMKHMQAKQERTTKEKQFHKQFRLIDLVKQFRQQLQKLPQNERLQKHRILIDHYLKVIMNQCEINPEIMQEVKGKLSAEYMPIFDYLIQKIEQSTLFNQKGLIICARSRTILAQKRPYIISRKRNLTMLELKHAIKNMKLKINYFTLNTNTLNNLRSDVNNKSCEVLFLILTIDCPNAKVLNFGEDNGINAEPMDIKKFATQIKSCEIKVLIICGKNSIKMCQELVSLRKDWANFPNIVAIQNNKYNICDEPYNNYSTHSREKAWQFLCNEVNQIACDMLIISIVANINSKLSHDHVFTEQELDEKINKSLNMVHSVLQNQFECTSEVLNELSFKIWASNKIIEKIQSGDLQDLTSKFYSSEHNLHDENYYENIGRCQEVNQVIEAIAKGQRCIEIIGNPNTGKSTVIQEICWISQTKNLFKFGVFLFRLNEDRDTTINKVDDFFRNRQFKPRQNYKTNQKSVLIAFDNVDDQFINGQKQVLKNLIGKSVTIIYSTVKKQFGQAFQSLLEFKQCPSINLNKITLNEVYGFLMSHIKLYRWSQGHRYSKKVVQQFEKKVEGMMKMIQKVEDENKLSKALELLKEINPKREEERVHLMLNFFRKNFDGLRNRLNNIKQIRVKII